MYFVINNKNRVYANLILSEPDLHMQVSNNSSLWEVCFSTLWREPVNLMNMDQSQLLWAEGKVYTE